VESITGLTVKLVGEDGNAFVILGKCNTAMRKAKIDQVTIENFTKEATSGDYDHLLQTCIKYFDIE